MQFTGCLKEWMEMSSFADILRTQIQLLTYYIYKVEGGSKYLHEIEFEKADSSGFNLEIPQSWVNI